MKFSRKTILIGVGILLILLFATWYGWGKYQYLKERATIKEGQEEIQTTLENENASITSERDQLRQKIGQLNEENKRLKDKYAGLETQKQNIVVPTDPGDLVNAWNRIGIGARVNRRSRR